MTLQELFAQKAKAVKECRDLLDRVQAEGRTMTAEENQQYTSWEKEIDQANDSIKVHEQEKARRDRLAAEESAMREPYRPGPLQVRAAGGDGEQTKPDRRSLAEKLRDLSESGMSRVEALAAISVEKSERAAQKRKAFGDYLRGRAMIEHAALQMDVDASGGFLVAPEQFVARLIQDMDRIVFMRSLATIIPLSGSASLGVPTLDTDISDTNWTTELAIGTMDTSLIFGKRRLTPHPLAKPIRVSKDLMRSAAISPEAIVRERMLYKFGTVQESAFLTGNGSAQPLGVFTASAAGISTGQDSSTGNTTTAITADGLIECKYKLESQWLASPALRWIFHRDAVKNIRKLKDGDGQYLWQPGLTADRGDVLLGVPIAVSEYAPNTFTTGLYVGIIGDFSYYWIADSMSVEIQRLVELYAATNEDGFHGRMILDGMPVLEKAFARLKLA